MTAQVDERDVEPPADTWFAVWRYAQLVKLASLPGERAP
jgi:hypothetical protein